MRNLPSLDKADGTEPNGTLCEAQSSTFPLALNIQLLSAHDSAITAWHLLGNTRDSLVSHTNGKHDICHDSHPLRSVNERFEKPKNMDKLGGASEVDFRAVQNSSNCGYNA